MVIKEDLIVKKLAEMIPMLNIGGLRKPLGITEPSISDMDHKL